jgi:hypothetical protein
MMVKMMAKSTLQGEVVADSIAAAAAAVVVGMHTAEILVGAVAVEEFGGSLAARVLGTRLDGMPNEYVVVAAAVVLLVVPQESESDVADGNHDVAAYRFDEYHDCQFCCVRCFSCRFRRAFSCSSHLVPSHHHCSTFHWSS